MKIHNILLNDKELSTFFFPLRREVREKLKLKTCEDQKL